MLPTGESMLSDASECLFSQNFIPTFPYPMCMFQNRSPSPSHRRVNGKVYARVHGTRGRRKNRWSKMSLPPFSPPSHGGAWPSQYHVFPLSLSIRCHEHCPVFLLVCLFHLSDQLLWRSTKVSLHAQIREGRRGIPPHCLFYTELVFL